MQTGDQKHIVSLEWPYIVTIILVCSCLARSITHNVNLEIWGLSLLHCWRYEVKLAGQDKSHWLPTSLNFWETVIQLVSLSQISVQYYIKIDITLHSHLTHCCLSGTTRGNTPSKDRLVQISTLRIQQKEVHSWQYCTRRGLVARARVGHVVRGWGACAAGIVPVS